MKTRNFRNGPNISNMWADKNLGWEIKENQVPLEGLGCTSGFCYPSVI